MGMGGRIQFEQEKEVRAEAQLVLLTLQAEAWKSYVFPAVEAKVKLVAEVKVWAGQLSGLAL